MDATKQPVGEALSATELEQAVREAFPYVFGHYGNDPRIPASFAMLRDLLLVHRVTAGVLGTPAPARLTTYGDGKLWPGEVEGRKP